MSRTPARSSFTPPREADYDRADELLSKAEEAQDRTLQRAGSSGARCRTRAVSRLRLGKAATRAERGELSLTRLDYIQAANHFGICRRSVDSYRAKIKTFRLEYLLRSAYALVSHGDEKGDNAVLAQAVAVYRKILNECSRERVPLQRAMTQNNLGMRRFGHWASGGERTRRTWKRR